MEPTDIATYQASTTNDSETTSKSVTFAYHDFPSRASTSEHRPRWESFSSSVTEVVHSINARLNLGREASKPASATPSLATKIKDIIDRHSNFRDLAYFRGPAHRVFGRITLQKQTASLESKVEVEPWANLSFPPFRFTSETCFKTGGRAYLSTAPPEPTHVPSLTHLPVARQRLRIALLEPKMRDLTHGTSCLGRELKKLAALVRLDEKLGGMDGKRTCCVCVQRHPVGDFWPWMLNRSVEERVCKRFLRTFHRAMETYSIPTVVANQCLRCNRHITRCPRAPAYDPEEDEGQLFEANSVSSSSSSEEGKKEGELSAHEIIADARRRSGFERMQETWDKDEGVFLRGRTWGRGVSRG